MPIAPTQRMQTMHQRYMAATITVATTSTGTDVDPNTGQPANTTTPTATWPATIDHLNGDRYPIEGRDLDINDRQVTVPHDAVIEVGQHITIVDCPGDSTLDGRSGSVTFVESQSARSARRFIVRMST